ncbi:MAG: LacI family DNA-binding transcriptional regulator [Hespellia sp.]|nr:LacI family DNA-binding transcriptional regulator [Hespellia sp.]
MSTIFDVAKEAGVSKSTVSRVINGDAGVKDATRIAVQAAIKKLHYEPSYMAQAIRTRKTHTIAMIVPEYTNIFYTEMFQGVEDVALKYGYMVFVCDTERHSIEESEYLQELLKRNIDGMIYNCYKLTEEMAHFLSKMGQKIPIVYMNKIVDEIPGASCVYTDGFESTRQAVKYLYDNGKRKIGYVRNSEDISIIEDRYQGFVQGLKDCNLAYDEKWMYRVQRENEPDYVRLGRDAARYYASLQDKPDAIMTAIDMIGIGCIKEFNSMNVKVPEEISVVGFDNVFLSNLIEPPLTTISQPIRKMGQAAAEILIAQMEGRKTQKSAIFQGDLIVRKTT